MCGFYATVLPLCIIWSSFALIVHYLVDKWNFLRYKIIKYKLSADLSREMIEQLEYFLPIYSISSICGYFFFYIKLKV